MRSRGMRGDKSEPPAALVLEGGDPALNLAIEEALFDALAPGEPGWLLLWRNRPAVIIGRHQIAGLEVDAGEVKKAGVPVIRRMTGGGAVYHDLDNLNFSFIQNSDAGFAFFLGKIQGALRKLGIDASMGGRNDLQVGGKKISGASMRRFHGKTLCHGTLLLHVDFQKIGRFLTPAKSKLARRGISSVEARVAGIAGFAPVDMPILRDALLCQCAGPSREPAVEIMEAADVLAERKYRNPDWNIGAHAPFNKTRRASFAWGSIEARMLVENGVILSCRIIGDCIGDGPEIIAASLAGCRLDEISARLSGMAWERLFIGCDPHEATAFFAAPGFGA